MRNFINFVRNTLMFIGFLIATALYVMIAAGMATIVINDIQLDTYVTLKTGFAAVLWMILTIWVPIILFCGTGRIDRNQIILDSDGEAW